MHYAKYASMYLKRTFFFDANPPLGKLLVALAGYLVGFDGGSFGFEKIGAEYPEEVPVFAFRLVPALFGSLITPTVYLILCELGLNPWAGALAGILVLLGMSNDFTRLDGKVDFLFCRYGCSCSIQIRPPGVNDACVLINGSFQRPQDEKIFEEAILYWMVVLVVFCRLEHGPCVYRQVSRILLVLPVRCDPST